MVRGSTPEVRARCGWQPAGPPEGQARPVAQLPWELAQEQQASLFAVADGALDDQLFCELSTGQEPFEPLYDGAHERLFAVSPMLVQLQPGSALFARLSTGGWGHSRAVYLVSPAPLESLARHLRRFTVVETEEQEQLFFRFHDPRVLRVFLPAASVAQRELLFGPVLVMMAESEDGTELLHFGRREAAMGPADPAPAGQLQISRAQMELFSRYMVRQFRQATMAALMAEHPARCAALGQGGLRRLVVDGMRQAEQQGILTEREVRRFIFDILSKP